MWGVASGGSYTAMQSASYSGPGTLDLKYVWNNVEYSVFTFDANKVAPSVLEYFANEDYPEFFEFSKMGTYRFTYAVEAKHRSGTDADDTDDVTHSDTETYTFHVGPIAELEVSDGGARGEARPDQVAFNVRAINHGPDLAPGAEVDIDLDLPAGVTVAAHVASDGTYDETNGKWDLGALEPWNDRRVAGRPDAATLAIFLKGEGAQFAEASAVIRNDSVNHPYAVCLEADHGHVEDVDADNEADCAAHGGSWHEATVYDHRDDNNNATLRAHYGAGKAPAENESTPAIVVKWRAVEDRSDFRVSHYQVWRSHCDDQEPVAMAADLVADNVSETVWVDLDVAAGQTYCYRVRAVSVYGAQGPFSRVMEKTALLPVAIPAGAPDAPALTATPNEPHGDTQILLTWNKPVENGSAIISYTVEVANRSNGPWSAPTNPPTLGPDATSWTHAGLPDGTTRYYRLLATNGQGDSPWSNVVEVSTRATAQPSAPENVRAAPDGGNAIDVSWDEPRLPAGHERVEHHPLRGAVVGRRGQPLARRRQRGR